VSGVSVCVWSVWFVWVVYVVFVVCELLCDMCVYVCWGVV
jgi:hypothetical protein